MMHRAALRIRQACFTLNFDQVATFAQNAKTPALVVTGEDGVIGADRLHNMLDREMRFSRQAIFRSPASDAPLRPLPDEGVPRASAELACDGFCPDPQRS
ncbi:hypothetical protein FQV39_07420 [Bosea sp. F3-2]|uniref:hypothetical protein n=1 Tax=Bosea sp. F3-2 TaxID=2599640 RepID=UPI0011EF007C|nr:hypothetical protein [Bosea sp. F3-2]QEL22414.1 hypothetical protein FQV39_07420 [Bosea sp. F3-2]